MPQVSSWTAVELDSDTLEELFERGPWYEARSELDCAVMAMENASLAYCYDPDDSYCYVSSRFDILTTEARLGRGEDLLCKTRG